MNKYYVQLTFSDGSQATQPSDNPLTAESKEKAVNYFIDELKKLHPDKFINNYIQHVEVERVETQEERMLRYRLESIESKVEEATDDALKARVHTWVLYIGLVLMILSRFI